MLQSAYRATRIIFLGCTIPYPGTEIRFHRVKPHLTDNYININHLQLINGIVVDHVAGDNLDLSNYLLDNELG